MFFKLLVTMLFTPTISIISNLINYGAFCTLYEFTNPNLVHNISLATSANENIIFIFLFFYNNYNFFTVKTSKFWSQRWYILNRLAMTAHIR